MAVAEGIRKLKPGLHHYIMENHFDDIKNKYDLSKSSPELLEQIISSVIEYSANTFINNIGSFAFYCEKNLDKFLTAFDISLVNKKIISISEYVFLELLECKNILRLISYFDNKEQLYNLDYFNSKIKTHKNLIKNIFNKDLKKINVNCIYDIYPFELISYIVKICPLYYNEEQMITYDDYLKFKALIESPEYFEITEKLLETELFIIFFSLGFIDEKYLSIEVISEYLGINETEVNHLLKTTLENNKSEIALLKLKLYEKDDFAKSK